jgi:vacuolar-type H+-ATPase subunit E/Vma4
MGLPELLDALESEVDRQVREIEAQARRDGERRLAEVRDAVAERRRSSLERERARLDEEASRTRSRLRVERERTLLTEKREILMTLRREIEQRAATTERARLLAKLLDELLADSGADDDAPIHLRVEPGSVELVRHLLEEHHPDLARRAEVEGVEGMACGVELGLEGEILDNTLPSRMVKLWPVVEGRVATILFGDDRDGV